MTDFAKYQALQSFMRTALHSGQFPSEEFDDAWQACEDIKNKNGGMPPPPDDYDALDMELAETANMEGTR